MKGVFTFLPLGLCLACGHSGDALTSVSPAPSATGVIIPGVYTGPVFDSVLQSVEQKLVSTNVVCSEKADGPCDPVYCKRACSPWSTGNDTASCILVCTPKSCGEIDADKCPTAVAGGVCQLRAGCGGIVCAQAGEGSPTCGDQGYDGALVGCCPGLIRRCGTNQGNGTCGYSRGFPQCLSCGDGKCDSSETPCNCPEDCGALSK